jgi:capsular polysaccharide transport system permease protein
VAKVVVASPAAAKAVESGPAAIAKPDAVTAAVAAAGPMASPAQLRPRHRLLMLSFLVVVFLPLLVSAAYLWGIAKDQYASTVGFSVRREDATSAADILGGRIRRLRTRTFFMNI